MFLAHTESRTIDLVHSSPTNEFKWRTETSRAGTITVSERIVASRHAPVQPRAYGHADLSVVADRGGTHIAGLRQSGSLKLLFPRAVAPALQAVAINCAGGVTGGDEFAMNIRAGCGAQLTLTTQAAERAYRVQPGQRAAICNRVVVEDGAHVNWLPQETILFRACAVDRTLTVEMEADATLLMAEPLVFGRAAMGETLDEASFRDRIEIRRAGQIAFLDTMALDGNVAAHLARPTVAARCGAMASLVYMAPNAEAHLPLVRAMLPETGGASLVRDDILFLRALAPDSFSLRTALIPILNRLTGGALPRHWMI